ncbi:neural cell adhesion molecule 1-B isoform X2 [Folsomia candida]|uniref:neural cell adhesion molecule 1-B isoform X2 n=1 Tax=Folsomia candida TaxID=158441 RepID=UPI000B8FCBDD|nr:neural cell adhesion molecule 1-B isoform X2 [Folsomia candida]
MDFMVKLGLLAVACLGLVALTSGQQVTLIPGEKNVKKFINESYFVSCQTPDGLRADWYNSRQQKIDGNPQNRIRVETSFAVDLFLTRITSQDSGTYTCVTNRGGRASFNLNVLRPITFDLSYAEQSASEGKMYTMKCVAMGQNAPKIYWKVDNKNPMAPKFRITKENHLIIQNVTREDGKRQYVCRAMDMESPVPDAKTMNITLKVKTKPRMVHGARLEHWGVLGEWANLTCAVNAEPPARFEWVFKDRTITPNDENFILYPQENTSILQVLVRNEVKFGQYICRARNDQGYMEKGMILHKGQKPATPVLEIDLVAHDGARIRVREFRNPSTRDPAQEEGRKGKALPITGYVVQYKMMTRSDWKPANSSKYEEGFVIRDLQPGITYQVRAASRNQASVGEYSHPITVLTSKTTSWSISLSTSIYMNSVIWTILNLITLSTLALII